MRELSDEAQALEGDARALLVGLAPGDELAPFLEDVADRSRGAAALCSPKGDV